MKENNFIHHLKGVTNYQNDVWLPIITTILNNSNIPVRINIVFKFLKYFLSSDLNNYIVFLCASAYITCIIYLYCSYSIYGNLLMTLEDIILPIQIGKK